MAEQSYKFGDVISYEYCGSSKQGIVWEVYDKGLYDYTILNEWTKFDDIQQYRIIGSTSIKSDNDIHFGVINDFANADITETMIILNVVCRSDKYDLQIINYLNKVMNYYKPPKQGVDMVRIRANKLLNLIKDKNSEVVRNR